RAVVGCSSDRVTKFYIPLGKGLVGEVVETRQPVIFNKMEDNHTYLKSIEDAVGFKAKNVAATPIVIRSRIFGVIELLNRTSDEGFSQQDIDFLVYTTQLAARAIEARLILNWAMQNQPISQQKAA
ncbi:MAG: GAF domain-containing protein, partial [Bdellovibrio sp.]|nr:GAF domain-containing protein [Bdellovibrio sp.]